MAPSEDRRPPADPWQIALNYQPSRPWWFDADDAVTTWIVTAEVEDDGGRPVQHVADIDIVVVELVGTRDPIGLSTVRTTISASALSRSRNRPSSPTAAPPSSTNNPSPGPPPPTCDRTC